MAELRLPYILVTSSLKKTATVSFVGLTGAASAVTATFAKNVNYSGLWSQISQPIATQASSIYSDLVERAKTGYQKVSEQYTSTYKKITDEAEDDTNNLVTEWKKGEDVVSKTVPHVSNLKTYNYYTFTNREVIKSAIQYLPTMIRDSIKDGLDDDGEIYELLSFRKIAYIVQHEKFNEFVKELSQIEQEKDKLFDKMTHEDARGVMEILRSLPFEEGAKTNDKSSPRIQKFMTETIQNMKEINKDKTKSYSNAKELIVEILAGKNAQQEIKDNLEKVIKQLKDKSAEILQKVNVTEVNVSSAKANLEALKQLLEALEGKTASGPAAKS